MVSIDTLSRGFIQTFCETGGGVSQPVVQVLDARPLVSGQDQNASQAQYYRFRISDGMFSYNSVLSQNDIIEKVRGDNLDDGNPVICITSYVVKPTQIKNLLRILDYEILGRDVPIFGTPVAHSGNAKDYLGMNPESNLHIPKPQVTVEIPERSSLYGLFAAPQEMNIRTSLCLPGRQNVTPIKLITPYVNKWRICGMVTAKEDLREIKTARKDMRVFNFELTDDEGSSIRVAAFDDSADKFYAIIQTNAMFYLSGGTVKQSNKRFNSTGHDYEIVIRNDTEVFPCLDREKFKKPKLSLNIVSLDKVGSHIGQTIDIIAIIEKVGDVSQVTTRGKGSMLEKREVQLIDSSEASISLTLWADQTKICDQSVEGQTIAAKGVFVREYNGSLSLSVSSSSRVELNSDCPETAKLYQWYREKRPSIQAQCLTTHVGSDTFARDLRLIGISNAVGVGRGMEKGAYFNVVGMITSLRSDGALYKSCGNNGCKKKVIEIDNYYRCEKCNLTNNSYKYVLLLSLEISDFTGSQWITAFEETAAKLLQTSSEELGMLIESARLEEYNKIFSATRFRQFSFRIRAKSEIYNSIEKVKWNAYDVNEIQFDKYAEELTNAIDFLEKYD